MFGRKKQLLDSDAFAFASNLDREQLLAYFMGCAISGLCAANNPCDTASAAASIAKLAFEQYCKLNEQNSGGSKESDAGM